ncbi:Splicing factor: suppressor of white-apricot-like protein [Leptotrombidium deliense]|uniref:Splicing factor: suppressor of white-apricot-like protein n=1 Tax=Leptotrombidium deliense TaxID=299467 RepID=A0A443SB74_9ACAR|nr:Splicing factor: suppressor of white-apricot-like protein [Leptotrombidium deliense]
MSRKVTEKRDANREDDELLVFGYSCKLFKDEKKARLIDQGKHLIPWMGCERYLQDLRLYEAKSGIYNKELEDELTADELEIERLCDEERYSDLKFDDDDSHEEQLKRLRATLAVDGAYHEIHFNYDTCETHEEDIKNGDNHENAENDPFVVPAGLIIPEGILWPETMKQHNLIEKTANFISKHGVQMEILIKTKQSSNPQFDFLAFDSQLNPYYKFLVSVIKSGKYEPKTDDKDCSEVEESDEESDDNYLHPSLLGTKSKSPIKPLVLPTLPRSENETDSYSLLVKSLRDKIPVEPESDNVESDENQTRTELSTELNQGQSSSVSAPVQVQQNWSSLLPSPPPEIEVIIEKLAQYVAKNGEEFESTVRKRGEERFEFLNPGTKYHAHYIRKKLQYLEDKRKTQAAEMKLKCLEMDIEKQLKTPVCFSFKEKKINNVQLEDKVRKISSEVNTSQASKKSSSAVENEPKKSETALADKLAAAVRDRLAREKQLQEERKRKAALFLSLVKNKELQQETRKSEESDSEHKSQTTYGPLLPANLKNEMPLSEDNRKIKATELSKNTAVLPFVISDEPLKESSSHRNTRTSHRHHHHRHRHSHHRRYDRSRSRSRSSRSRSRSKSPLHRKKSRTRSRSRSRSSKK